MSDKYIIRNCPAFVLMRTATSGTYFDMCGNAKGHIKCADCTDCVMKQIVELCKKEIRVYRNMPLPNDGTNTLHFGRQSFAYDILKLLDIQEVE